MDDKITNSKIDQRSHGFMPNSKKLEECILGTLLVEPESVYDVIDILNESMFFSEPYRLIFKSINTVYSKGSPVDLITVTDEVKKDQKFLKIVDDPDHYVANLTYGVVSSTNIITHSYMLLEYFIKRKLIEIALNIQRKANDNSTDSFSLLDEAESSLLAIDNQHARQNYKPIGDLVTSTLSDLVGLREKKYDLTGIPSGFTDLDRVTSGWQNSDLIVIAARPGMGKCLGKGTKVLRYNGYLCKVEDIQEGDLLMGPDSKPYKAISITKGRSKMYKIKQTRGINYTVNIDHILSLKSEKGDILNISVDEYIKKPLSFKDEHKGYRVSVDFEHQKLTIDPYREGLTCSTKEDIDDGFICSIILNSLHYRYEFLAGVIDSYGFYDDKLSCFVIDGLNRFLSEKINFLCHTIGFRCVISSTNNLGRLNIYGDIEKLPIKKWKSNDNNEDCNLSDIELEYIGIGDYYGFELENGPGLFLLEDMTVTHNTSFVLSALRNAAVDHKKAVAIFSLEMAGSQLTRRLISGEARIPGNDFKNPKNITQDKWVSILPRVKELQDSFIYIDDTPAISILELRTKSRILKKQKNIELLVVDYIQLMAGDHNRKNTNREQEVAHISRSLKHLAKELDIPVIVVSQLNRALESRGGDKKPQLSDLRESGSIEQDSDIVIFLYRPSYYDIKEDEEGNDLEGLTEVIIAKHRNGPLTTVNMKFLDDYTQFVDLDKDIDATKLNKDNNDYDYIIKSSAMNHG